MIETPEERKKYLAGGARALGLEAFGVASVDADLRREYFLNWIAGGKHGEMGWMDNPKRADLKTVMPECKNVVVLGWNYFNKGREQGGGRYALYAQYPDYHKTFLKKLKSLCAIMKSWGGEQKPYVDTGPILEKRFAETAGLGWQGKNTLLISPEYGPWLFLGVILTTLELPVDTPGRNRCGTCTRCMKACPTGAITAPYQLDPRRCIAYWTIEHKGEIPEEFHKAMGDRLYGCDECLTACPWNKFAKESAEMKGVAREYPGAEEILTMDEEKFEKVFAGSPIKRLGLERLKRNATIVVGNLKQGG